MAINVEKIQDFAFEKAKRINGAEVRGPIVIPVLVRMESDLPHPVYRSFAVKIEWLDGVGWALVSLDEDAASFI